MSRGLEIMAIYFQGSGNKGHFFSVVGANIKLWH